MEGASRAQRSDEGHGGGIRRRSGRLGEKLTLPGNYVVSAAVILATIRGDHSK